MIGPTVGPIIAGIVIQFIAETSPERGKLQQDQAADRRHHRAAEPLHDAHQQQHRQVRGNSAERRASRENRNCRAKHHAGAEPVGDPAAQRDEHREAQQVGRDHQVEAQRIGAETFGHVGDRDGDHRRIEAFHKKGAADHQRDQDPAPALVSRAGVRIDPRLHGVAARP